MRRAHSHPFVRQVLAWHVLADKFSEISNEAISAQTPTSPPFFSLCLDSLGTMPFTLKNAACGGAEKRANPYATESVASPAKKAKAPAASSLVALMFCCSR